MFTSLGNSIPRNGLVGEWLLDGNALDTSGNGNNGTATNITYVKTYKGYVNQSASLGGANSSISIPNNTNIQLLGNYTYGGWFNSTTNNSIQRMINKDRAADFTGGYCLMINNNSGYQYYISHIGGGAERGGFTGVPVKPNGEWHHYIVRYDGATIKLYIDAIQVYSKNVTTNLSGDASAPLLFGAYGSTPTGQWYNGKNELIRIYNRALSDDEIQILYLEGQKLLGPTNIAKYPKLFEGLVGYFENPTGTTELWNIANGVNSTRVAGSNTTDNLGNNRALSNPNYTWTSITYTTGYTFENSGSGWSIVTNPLGLLGTGINRVTTLRNVFLFTRTLSSDEVTLLQNLCNSNYIYPNPSYDLPNLRDGLVLDLNEQGKDLSGNSNNGTLVNSPVVVRQGRANGLILNGTSQYETTSNHSSLQITGDITLNCWIKWDGTNPGGNNDFGVIFTKHDASFMEYEILFSKATGNINFYRGASNIFASVGGFSSNWHMLTVTHSPSGNLYKLYKDGVQITSGASTVVGTSSTGGVYIGRSNTRWAGGYYFNGKIVKPKIYNRALSDREIQQLYYSQKGNFVY